MLLRSSLLLAILQITNNPLFSHAQSTGSSGTNGAASVSLVNEDIAFALNIPEDSDTDLYFSIQISTSLSWAAIGFGSNKMAGSLMLILYPASSSTNFTLSPRIASGHSEPVYSPNVEIEAQAGTGLVNNTEYLFNGKCLNCRTWKGGSINITNKAQQFTYGIGPAGGVHSDDLNAPLNYHQAYGSFSTDMTLATGPGGVPGIGSVSRGTTRGKSKSGKSDSTALMHAILMILAFVGLFPMGILLLRLGNSVRWHLMNQAAAFVLVLAGTVLGLTASTSYNRSKTFSNPHQIIGLLIFGLVIVQYTLGYLHHRSFEKNQQTTKMAPIHIWLGRSVIVLGILIAFTGFPFALSLRSDAILASLVVFMAVTFFGSFLVKRIIKKRSSKDAMVHADPDSHEMQSRHPSRDQAVYTSRERGGGPEQAILTSRPFEVYHHGSRADTIGLQPPESTRGFI